MVVRTVEGPKDAAGGATQVMVVDDTNVANAAVLPNLHWRWLDWWKLVPVMVTLFPPFSIPAGGRRETRSGTSWKWNILGEVLKSTPPLVEIERG